MTTSRILIFALLGAMALLVPLLVRPRVTVARGGRVFAFLALAVVPAIAGMLGLDHHMEHSKTTAFCLSCHPMEQYGKSLHVDDVNFLAGAHYQFGRVPRETACYACHTTYTMFGDYAAKLDGLRHVWVQYFGTVPEKIHHRGRYRNRECLHCHAESRSFVEAVTHRSEPGRMDAIRGDSLSCLSSGCHDTVHGVDKLGAVSFWEEPK
jgi:cytochrome c-type protein NapC